MKFIHMADMHFDSSFNVLALKKGLGNKRRLEQREILKNAIEYIKNNNIEYVFISGDLYEQKYIRESTIKYINELFKSIPKTKIFITPGNHDPYLKNSFYSTFTWGENVFIFDGNIKCIETDEADIYGVGFDDFYCENSKINEIKIKNKDKLNILITHSALNASSTLELSYNPIKENELRELGFDYVALGHIHKANFNENTKFVYPGSMISFGFDELGEHGMLEVELDKENAKFNFIKLDNRIFEERKINISEINSIEEIIEKINNGNYLSENMYKIILTGTKNFEINISEIEKLITVENILKIKDFSEYEYNLNELANQKTLKGIYIKKCLEKLASGDYGEEQIKKAIEIGLGVL